ncbi:MAG TPA: hypothetical protein VG652_01025 [Gaiellaceae bacterium]|nr:hypothetical protein [Gaiellaceae bacterium]
MEGKRSARRSAVGSGLATGLSTVAVSGSAAAAGVILARKFDHGVKTDGFFAAYNAYVAIVLLTGVLRVVVLPRFVRARDDGRLPGEVGAWMAGVTLPLAPLVLVSLAWPHQAAGLLTGSGRAQAAALLPWIVPSAAAQVYGGVVASALAARDNYGVAAFGFGAGSVAGILLTVALIGHGVVAFGWGIALNGAVSLLIPLAVLVRRQGVSRPDQRVGGRLVELAEGVALPVAMQILFVVANRFASGIGTGEVTTFSYAYLIAAFLVAVTASSIALVTTVPVARAGDSPERTVRHVVAVSWLSLAVVAAAVGVFALAGETVVHSVLGASYRGGTGTELGRLVIYLAPWTIASVAFSIAFPLLFVRGRAKWLPLLALSAIGVQVLVEWASRGLFGLAGLAAGLAVTTWLVLAVVLAWLRALVATIRGLLVAALVCGGVALVTFGLPRTVLGPISAAAVGLVLYTAFLVVWRPAGLRTSWTYIRTLY